MRNRQVETPLPTLGIGEVASKTHKLGTILESASRAAATYTTDPIHNYEAKGLRLFFDLTNVGGAGIVTTKVQVRDPVTGNWVDLSQNIILAAVATTILTIYPGLIPWQSFNRASSISPSDTVDIPQVPEAIWIGGAGVLAAILPDNSVQNFTVPAGVMLPLRPKRINLTNTTATLLVAMYQAALAINSPLGLEWRLTITVSGNAVVFSVGGQYLN